MARIEALYGVIHGVDAVSIFGDQEPIFIEPSAEVQKLLDRLQPGTSVGIEYDPGLASLHRFGYQQVQFSPSTISYWQQIEEMCRERKLPIVYLDDVRICRKAAKHALKEASLRRLALEIEESDTTEEGFAVVYDCRHEAYCRRVIWQYILEVEREQAMLTNMVRYEPQFVIIGKGHGNMLMREPSLLAQHDITIGAYHAEVEISNADELLRRTLLTRSYNAVVSGRVDPASTPDYIGYWQNSESFPELGLFEVFLDRSGGFEEGNIIDCFGDAHLFLGRLTDDNVYFAKEYDPNFSADNATGGPIVYRGERRGEEYQGTWATTEYSGNFILQPYTPGIRLFSPLVME